MEAGIVKTESYHATNARFARHSTTWRNYSRRRVADWPCPAGNRWV